ncbi:iron-siderophore ABC transporter substrate-binding protein [Ochrobactrum pecoris]|uniref:Iron complex transport system substrate-binding protein n=1 Tax=Brucella pecoris TaxID=867683 RepID=A0A5C5CE18_9HYPH|nr:iron-siderophore ABC transporter substrate-binding protein [Brucella pecoris]MBB4095695.1 iron complex transport system substrate-binding protein [Brucella pecoris]NKW81794.1 iron-siderophore ABC transporter substrate-binding protein [Brucella pecoris]TNV09607.1 iron-siderophore ABC transporter substrate-binding protein [Brucella pecoris]
MSIFPFTTRSRFGVCSRLLLILFVIVATTPAKADEHFPVAVKHVFGVTTVKVSPARIITIGWNGEDAVLALGHIPVAMSRYDQFEDGIFPWDRSLLKDSHPALLAGELDYEQIASLKPDLILAVYSGINEMQWRRLSSIAPTVVYRSGPWEADWKEVISITGEALGKPAEAQTLVRETETFLRDLGARNTELQGKTFTFGTYLPGANDIIVYMPNDPRVAVLTLLGLEVPPAIQHLSREHPEKTSVSISLEQINQIDADIMIMWYREQARIDAESQPLFNSLTAVNKGAYVALDDPVSVWATSALSVLSIPYGFPQFVPRLVEAASKAERRR